MSNPCQGKGEPATEGRESAFSTLLNAGYFLPIVYRAFFVSPTEDDHRHEPPRGEAPLPMVLALCATAAATVLLFFLPDVPLALARQTIGL